MTEQSTSQRWAGWRLDVSSYTLVLEEGAIEYEVDLESCTTSAEVLDWIAQVASKPWSEDRTLAGLVRALNDILDPQATLCSDGSHKTITVSDVRRMVASAARHCPTLG